MMMNCIPPNAFVHGDIDRGVFCGCGVAFANRKAFKEHNLLGHEGQHIAGSSHFLSKFTRVVLPARTQRTQIYRQDAPLLACSAEEDVHVGTKRKTKISKSIPLDQKGKQANQSSDQCIREADLENLALVWNDGGNRNYRYYCGNCRQRSFSTAAEFVIHLRDICPVDHNRSSHFLTLLDYDKEIQEYMRKNHRPKQRANIVAHKVFFKAVFGTNIDHSDLPILCGPCRQIFSHGFSFFLHSRRIHQGQIDPSSSHVILRFKGEVSICLTDKMQWMHDEETALCPCAPSRKMTVAKLIQHVRQVHHGVSPIYERKLIEAVNAQFIKPVALVGKTYDEGTNSQHSQQQNSAKVQQLVGDDESIEGKKQQGLLTSLSAKITRYLVNLRLVRSPMANSNNIYFCGNCRKKDFKDSVSLILHLRYVCKVKSPNSSHILRYVDLKKEIEDYQIKNSHCSISMKGTTRAEEALLKSLNLAFDHSDLSFECGVCRQLFEESRSYYVHALTKHSQVIDSKSSHIVLRIPWNNKLKRKNIYISDRVPWVNNDQRYYCPCKPQKKTTMEGLVKHVRKVHMGISPQYYL